MRFIILFLILVQSLTCFSQNEESNIVLINVENLDRAGIAKEISIINSLKPKVISIDLQFTGSHGENDLTLINVLESCESLVMSSVIQSFGNNDTLIHLGGGIEFFPNHSKKGFINTILENDDIQTLRCFQIQQYNNFGKRVEYHFSVRTAMSVDSIKAINFVKRNPKIISIDYKQGQRKFKTFNSAQVFNGKITRNDIEDKIILVGFLGPGDEDKFYTPLNKRIKPYKPDMYGLEVLANIVAQVLECK